MVSKTFENLPHIKKERILNAVKKEIIEVGIGNARVVNICLEAGIPRSAFYRYFETIDDAFAKTIESLKKSKRYKFQKLFSEYDGDIFELSYLMLTDVLNDKDQFLLLKNISQSEYSLIKNLISETDDNFKKQTRKNQVIMSSLMMLTKQSAFRYYENKIPKKEILDNYKYFLEILKKGYDNF